MKNRENKIIKIVNSIDDDELKSFVTANIKTVKRIINGQSNSESGARMVVNISSAHIPAFCHESQNKKNNPYKNGYDLGKFQRLGDKPSNNQKLKNREIVDAALPLNGISPTDIYFGAVEINGTGIRYYGDMCLVLARSAIDSETTVLDRNSFDLIQSPLHDGLDDTPDNERIKKLKEKAKGIAGKWKDDICRMATIKVLDILGFYKRRYTIGQISRAVRNDEDYLEVLKVGSFSTPNLEEVRLSSAEAAHDAFTGDRNDSVFTPRMESLMWRHRRCVAEADLRNCDVPVRTITTPGRTRD